jgi:hypothetical protein
MELQDAVRESVEHRIARLEDAEEIRRLTIRYADGADRRNDPRIMRDLFARDAVWEAEDFGVFRGRDRILTGLREIARSRVSGTVHYMIAPLIEVARDRRSARASWRLWELAHLREEVGSRSQQVMAAGDYRCRLVRTNGKWRFQHVRLKIAAVVRCWADSGAGTPTAPRSSERPSRLRSRVPSRR